MKYTKKEVQGMFNRLAKAMNKETLGLDYAPIYGGYVIVEYGDKGSESHPFGSLRRSAREMYLSMHMTAQALEDLKFKEARNEVTK